jgi:hypothetical protein
MQAEMKLSFQHFCQDWTPNPEIHFQYFSMLSDPISEKQACVTATLHAFPTPAFLSHASLSLVCILPHAPLASLPLALPAFLPHAFLPRNLHSCHLHFCHTTLHLNKFLQLLHIPGTNMHPSSVPAFLPLASLPLACTLIVLWRLKSISALRNHPISLFSNVRFSLVTHTEKMLKSLFQSSPKSLYGQSKGCALECALECRKLAPSSSGRRPLLVIHIDGAVEEARRQDLLGLLRHGAAMNPGVRHPLSKHTPCRQQHTRTEEHVPVRQAVGHHAHLGGSTLAQRTMAPSGGRVKCLRTSGLCTTFKATRI